MNRSRTRALIAAALLAASTTLCATRSEAQTADELSQQAFDKYQAADYPSAVALYMKAYEQNVDSRILFNIAQIYDKKVQDRELAIEFYRRYLKSTVTEPELVAKSTARVAELTRQQQEAPPPPPPQPTPTPAGKPSTPQPAPASPPPAEPSDPPFFIGWIVTGAFAAGAIVTGSLALEAEAELSDATYRGSTPPEDVASTESSATVLAGVTDGLIAAAVVSAGVTLYLQLSHSPEPEAKRTGAIQLTPVASHNGGGAFLRGGF